MSLPWKRVQTPARIAQWVPSEDTFERVMQAVHLDEIAACLEVYTSQIIKDLSGLHIAIDGKKMRETNP